MPMGLFDETGGTIDGFGVGSMDQLQELNKALAPGYETDHSLFTDGDALRVESLDASLKLVTWQAKQIKFWKAVPKDKAYSTVEEWNVLDQYGSEHGGFMIDGELPPTEDSSYERQTGLVKFIGTTREITLGMTWIRTAHGDVIARETKNGILWLLEKLERALFWGDSSVIPVEFDGVFTQLLAANAGTENIRDLRGDPLSQEEMEDGSRIVADNFGNATDFWGSFKAISDLGKQMYPKERIIPPALNATEGRVGVALTEFVSEAGLVKLNGDVFLKSRGAPPTAGTSPKAPAAPTAVAGAPGASADSLFVAADAGNYFYRITAINRFGESTAVNVGPVAIVAGDGVTIVITDGGGAQPATGYRIYRTEVGGAVETAHYITQIARDKITPANTDFDELNEWLPNTTSALMIQNNEQGLGFKQLSPLVKLPLARISASVRWMQLMAGLMIIYAPKKHIVFKNIGPYIPA